MNHKSSRKGFTVIEIVIVIGILALLAGVYYFNQKDKTTTSTTDTTQVTTTPDSTTTSKTTTTTTTAEPVNNEKSDWKTYTDNDLGFSISYPKDWVQSKTPVGETSATATSVYLDSPENQKVEQEIKSGEMYGEGFQRTIYLDVFDSISDLNSGTTRDPNNLEDYIKNFSAQSNVKSISFAGQSAFSSTQGGFGAYYTIHIEKAGKIYVIRFGNREKESELSSIEKDVLGTYKFIK